MAVASVVVMAALSCNAILNQNYSQTNLSKLELFSVTAPRFYFARKTVQTHPNSLPIYFLRKTHTVESLPFNYVHAKNRQFIQ